MKIGLVRRGFSATGGAEAYLLRLAAGLRAAGRESILFGSPGWPEERREGIEFSPVEGRGPKAFADALAAARPRDRCDVLFSLERVWACDCYRAGDGVHRAWLERRAREEPAWRAWFRHWNPKHRQLLAIEETLLGRGGAKQIIANSEMVRREILAHYGGDAGRISVIYNGLPAAAFQPPAPGSRERIRGAAGLAERDFAVLFAGSGWERKGLRCLVEAVETLPESIAPRLLVAGRGNPGSLGRVSSRVRFLGPVADMAAVYAGADVFALPTLYDPFSNACLEAMAAGLPVMTTDANGFAEILEPGQTGEILTPGASLADALEAWADPGRRAAARPLCAEKAASFSIEANVESTLAKLCV
jgi:UDP-glucose:(heptosyl)LPS alpha-1,3-glucosyltransferase